MSKLITAIVTEARRARQIEEAKREIARLHRERRAHRGLGFEDRGYCEGVYKWNQRLRALKAQGQ